MSTKSEMLNLLNDSLGQFISGQQIADRLQVSRNAVWKAAAALKREGYEVESKTGSGYRLIGSTDVLSLELVQRFLNAPVDLQVYQSVTSTNDLMKLETLSHRPIAIIANKQTSGRGRLGRSFLSPGGTGLYLTIGLQPSFRLDQSLFVTMACAVAACRAIQTVCGIEPSIKWVNDIYYNGRKTCGILTEATTNLETGQIDGLIIGTGINCFPGSFPEEISHIAGPLSEEPGSFSRSRLAAELINETYALLSDVESRSFLDEYRRRCFIIGRRILIHPTYDEEGIPAVATGISDDGGLMVEYPDGRREILHTGEISVTVI